MKYQKAGDSCIANSRVICGLLLMLLRMNEDRRVKCRAACHAWERRKTHAELQFQTLKLKICVDCGIEMAVT